MAKHLKDLKLPDHTLYEYRAMEAKDMPFVLELLLKSLERFVVHLVSREKALCDQDGFDLIHQLFAT
jgi:hypothetical protein